MPVTLTSFAWVTLASVAWLLVVELDAESPGPRELAALIADPSFARPLVLSSVLATVIAISLMNLYQRDLEPVRAAVLYALEPIWAAVAGIAAGTDEWNGYLWVGGGLLLAGNLVAEIGQRAREPAPAG
jgi:drug/metabolite transporter (DMT)-like permease